MSTRASRAGLYLAILATLWLVWIVVFLPTQSVPSPLACDELRKLAQTQEETFVHECVVAMERGPERAAVWLLLATCLALILVCVAMWVRERRLVNNWPTANEHEDMKTSKAGPAQWSKQ